MDRSRARFEVVIRPCSPKEQLVRSMLGGSGSDFSVRHGSDGRVLSGVVVADLGNGPRQYAGILEIRKMLQAYDMEQQRGGN